MRPIDIPPETALFLVTGPLLAAAGALAFYLDPGGRANRALALFLLLLGAFFTLRAFDPGLSNLSGRLRWYVIIAIPFAAAHLAYVYLRPRLEAGWRRFIEPGLLVAVVLALEIVNILDRRAMGSYDAATGTNRVGSLEILYDLVFFSLAAVAALFAHLASREEVPLRKRTQLLVAVGFAIVPAYYGSFLAGNFLAAWREGTFPGLASFYFVHPMRVVGLTLEFFAWLLALGSGVLAIRGARPVERSWYPALLLCVFGTAFLAGFTTVGGTWAFHFWIYSAWALVAAFAISIPVWRRHLLGIEQRVWLVVKSSVLASIGVAIVFVVAEVLANRLSQNVSLSLGGFAAGGVLLAVHPLQRLAERLARRASPMKAVSDMSQAERLDLYREQASLAWMDGALQRKERLLLDRLRDRLGLDAAECQRIEQEAIA